MRRAVGRARRPDRRLRVPLPGRALGRQPRRRARRARRPRHLLPREPACTSTRGSARAASARRTTRCATTAIATHARGGRLRRRARRALHHLARDRGLQLPVPDAVRRDAGRGSSTASAQAAERAAERGVTIFLEHKNSEPAMKILMRNIGMTLHVIHTLRAPGPRQRQGQHGLAAPDHERREPRRVRGAARRRGAARPPARELRLGHLRRRQHGRRDRVHGDARARARAAPRRVRRRTASGSASTSTRTPRTRSPPCAARCCSGGSSTRSRRGSTMRRCARRRRRRTPCAPTSSSTPRSGIRRARAGAVRLQHVSIAIPLDGAERARAFYGGLLGLEERDVLPKLDPARFIWFRVGGDLELHLMLVDEPPPQLPHFCLVVDDLVGAARAARGGRRRDARRHRARRPAAVHLPRPVRQPRSSWPGSSA